MAHKDITLSMDATDNTTAPLGRLHLRVVAREVKHWLNNLGDLPISAGERALLDDLVKAALEYTTEPHGYRREE